MALVPSFVALPGLNVFFWSLVGLTRYLKDRQNLPNLNKGERQLINHLKTNAVAIAIAAKNEEKELISTLLSLCKLVPSRNIFVLSDGSTDKTLSVAKKLKVTCFEVKSSLGKANALVFLINKYKLLQRFNYIFFVDADIKVNYQFLDLSLPKFADSRVAALIGHARINWKGVKLFSWEALIKAYRERLYTVLQYAIRIGQTSDLLNVTPVIPGFATIYRTSVLSQIELNTPGLIIEDFNTAFQVQKKRLGKILYFPYIWAYGNEPTNLKDYISQINRWNLGFWQTLLKYKFWPSLFSLATLLFLAESMMIAFFFYFLPLILFLYLAVFIPKYFTGPIFLFWNNMTGLVRIDLITVAVLGFDYFYTVFVAMLTKKPILILYGPFFLILRFLDSVVIIASFFAAFFVKSRGVWVSPKRR